MMQHKPHTHTYTHIRMHCVSMCAWGSQQLLLSIGGSITRERMCKRARFEERGERAHCELLQLFSG